MRRRREKPTVTDESSADRYSQFVSKFFAADVLIGNKL